jgi:hypothetical protein
MANATRAGSRKFWGELLVAHPERLDDSLLDADVAHTRRNYRDVIRLLGNALNARGVRPHLFSANAGAARTGLPLSRLSFGRLPEPLLAASGYRATRTGGTLAATRSGSVRTHEQQTNRFPPHGFASPTRVGAPPQRGVDVGRDVPRVPD